MFKDYFSKKHMKELLASQESFEMSKYFSKVNHGLKIEIFNEEYCLNAS